MSLLKYIDSDDDRFRYGFKIIFDFHSNFELKKNLKNWQKQLDCLDISNVSKSAADHYILFCLLM